MGAHFYCITIGAKQFDREKESRGGGWVVGRASSPILGASFAKSSDVAAQLLGQSTAGEPYTVIIMGPTIGKKHS
jgi:hypothetical protein